MRRRVWSPTDKPYLSPYASPIVIQAVQFDLPHARLIMSSQDINCIVRPDSVARSFVAVRSVIKERLSCDFAAILARQYTRPPLQASGRAGGQRQGVASGETLQAEDSVERFDARSFRQSHVET